LPFVALGLLMIVVGSQLLVVERVAMPEDAGAWRSSR
jgi:hypothetical protein